MYLMVIRLTRLFFLAALVAALLGLLWPEVVPPWVPLGVGFCCVSLFLLASLHITRSRRHEFRCPLCGWVPFAVNAWKCGRCNFVWDSFATAGRCPRCGFQRQETPCLRCRRTSPNELWARTD
jgi:hypothetical protein